MSILQEKTQLLRAAIIDNDWTIEQIENATDDQVKSLLRISNDQYDTFKKWMPRMKDQLIGLKKKHDNTVMIQSIKDSLTVEQNKWLRDVDETELLLLAN